ncbi:MAG TPA: hypothetical protein V6D28_20365 [Leptolyngbyaceae cyanobacterium]
MMLQTKVVNLGVMLEELMPLYQKKWRDMALKPGPIDRDKAAETIKNIYALSGRKEPEIIFFDNIYQAFEKFVNLPVNIRVNYQVEKKLRSELYERLYRELVSQLGIELVSRLQSKMYTEVYSKLVIPLHRQLRNQLQLSNESAKPDLKKIGSHLKRSWGNCLQPEALFEYVSLLDYSAAVFNCSFDRDKWELMQSIVKYCSWTYPFEGICLACDRPSEISFDSQQKLHAEGKPALQFPDGYSIYSYHGVNLPEKYGKLLPHEWEPQWLLEENNAEIRRVLIQGIGYGRICQELAITELDKWQEYTLLKLKDYLDFEPIYLLKMTCPSTGAIHVLRVPPNLKSAREAISWVNWGTAPEEFAVQT